MSGGAPESTLDPRSVLDHAAAREEAFVEDLKTYLRVPSVSARRSGIEECVAYLRTHLADIGFDVQVFETAGNPILVAERAGRSDRTLLFYGHYDVQPEDPIDAWEHPPFAAEEVDGRIYARGAVDNKGNFFCIVKALQSWLERHEDLPCGVKIIVEGEEEIGSPSLAGFFDEHQDVLRADDFVWFDGGIQVDGRPEVCLGMKGMLYVDLVVRSAPRDLHSGKAPLVENAAWRLTWALASLYGPDHRVAIPGFYDGVTEPTERDLELLDDRVNRAEILADWGVEELRPSLAGLEGRELLRQLYFAPTCTICGLTSGYGGSGSKTVIPAEAAAKLDFRLAPGQEPEDVLAKLEAHLEAQGFADVEVRPHASMPASKSPSDAGIVDMVLDVMREGYAEPVVKPVVEGSGPGHVFERLGIPYVFSRLGPPEDRSHAPNEYTTRDAYRRGIATVVRLLDAYGRAAGTGDRSL